MNLFGPTPLTKLNEAVGFVLLFAVLFLSLALGSYQPLDPSFNTTAPPGVEVHNRVGIAGAHLADFLFQAFGVAAWLFPVYLAVVAISWLRSKPLESQPARIIGATVLAWGATVLLALAGDWKPFESPIPAGGMLGSILTGYLVRQLNTTGTLLAVSMVMLMALYLMTSFSIYHFPTWVAHPGQAFSGIGASWAAWAEGRRQRKEEKKLAREEARHQKRAAAAAGAAASAPAEPMEAPAIQRRRSEVTTMPVRGEREIPIRTLDEEEQAEPATPLPPVVEYIPPPPPPAPEPVAARPPWEEEDEEVSEPSPDRTAARPRHRVDYRLPPLALLHEGEGRAPWDPQELKETAARIKAKFEEFGVLGNVVQINPGPVVTTFEFKPEAGIKYSRITALTEDLCLGLQAESILIERIPGKPTVGIEVPNSRREVIALRQVMESGEFATSSSKLTISLGKDISGRIKVAVLETMPHVLIAGSTGSGKSVMLNSLIMSVLYKATPNDVRMILIDPKRVEMGVYEDIPHLLVPVITDPRKATNALRNAVLEMERRLKLLAAQGVRNIEQYNRKLKQRAEAPTLFDNDSDAEADNEPLPYILLVIDELADLMMIERANVEESVTRLAQMARAVGMHLVVATQRPSVDVITGLIKANFPARMSFRVATRVDSRTILDGMGAEHLLGKGDMLFLPPGSSRLVRVHAAYVTEGEIAAVTEFWKDQARPDYDQSYLLAPPNEDGESDPSDLDGFDDPAYQDAVRVVLEVGKASTSTLQRRLRLGYGRAARILDKMFHDGIIGPPDGSRPREVLKKPEWLDEVEDSVR